MRKALSIRQPWAELILQEKKSIETRTWNTKFRDEFYIHAGQKIDVNACKRFNLNPEELTTGAIIGKAKLTDVKAYNSKKEFLKDKENHLAENPKTELMFGYILKDVEEIKPIQYKGNLGFFNINIE